MNSSLYSPSPFVRFAAGVTYSILNVLGLLLYFIIGLALKRDWRISFAHNSFYVLVLNLLVADVGYLLVNVIVMIPQTFRATDLYGKNLGTVLASGNTFFFFTILFISFVIAADRMFYFYFLSFHSRIFEKPAIYLTVFMTWLGGFSVLILTSFISPCPKRFNYLRFHYFYDCLNGGGDTTPLVIISQTLPWFMICIYIAVFINVKKQRTEAIAPIELSMSNDKNHMDRAKKDFQILIQGSLICVVLWLQNLCFWFVPKIVKNAAGPIITSSLGAVNSSVNPIIYLCFCTAIKEAVAKVLRPAEGNAAQDSYQV